MTSKTDDITQRAAKIFEDHPAGSVFEERAVPLTGEWPNMRKGADGVYRLPTAKKIIYASPMVGYYAMKYMRCAWPKL